MPQPELKPTSPLPLFATERELAPLRADLLALRETLLAAEALFAERTAALPVERRSSATNLVHYLALRRRDVRELQQSLADAGLSSLGRSEARVFANLDAVLARLHVPGIGHAGPTDAREGHRLIEHHTRALFGPRPGGRAVHVMVTLPSSAADDAALVEQLVAAGMDVARINCAHDDPARWERMVQHVDAARGRLGRACRVLMDLAGPKLRTGAIEPGPAVRKWRPERDLFGRVVEPARLGFAATADGEAFVVSARFLAAARRGDCLVVDDTRGKKRKLRVVATGGGTLVASTDQSGYVENGARVRLVRRVHGVKTVVAADRIDGIAPREPALELAAGDVLELTRDAKPGRPAKRTHARVPCTLPEVFGQVHPSERIWFDDGKIGGRVTKADGERLLVEITSTPPGGAKLRADKGINLPDSELVVPALTAKDREDLDFVVRHADLVGLSFVGSEADVRELQRELAARNAKRLGIVLKIETRRAFERLPDLLLAALDGPPCGVMIARGDLAVECGWERMAELQEEILWMCEAAHLPVIWATQVLETLARTGQASRAEITDAAMGERAECVMLNKGPYVLEAVRALVDILARMQGHQEKKASLLRSLRIAERFFAPREKRRAKPG